MITVKNAHLLEACFGRWPDFRGADVSGIRLFAVPGRPAQLELDIEVVELFLGARGVYRDRQRCLTTLSFVNVLGAAMETLLPFRQEDALAVLEFAEQDDGSPIANESGGRRYRIRLVPTPGYSEAVFYCDEVAVLKALSISRAI